MDIYRYGFQIGQIGVVEVYKMLFMILGVNIGIIFIAFFVVLGVLAFEILQIVFCVLVGWKDGADRVVSGREIYQWIVVVIISSYFLLYDLKRLFGFLRLWLSIFGMFDFGLFVGTFFRFGRSVFNYGFLWIIGLERFVFGRIRTFCQIGSIAAISWEFFRLYDF